MNRRGFTLIELLAVIIILSLLALLTSTAITNIVRDSKQELSDTQISLIETAARLWGADNLDKLPDAGECGYLTVEDLKEFGLIDSNLIDPKTNENISDNLYIKITSTLSSYGVPVISYEVDPESVEGCKHSAQICSLVEGSSKVVGSEYNCTLDKDRTFYVLENNPSSDNISLIMDRNFTDDYVPLKTAWCTDGGDDNRTCKNINTTGNQALEGKDYIGHITEVFNRLEATVSFPTKDQLYNANNGSMSNLPVWLYTYLNNAGYWTSSAYISSNSYCVVSGPSGGVITNSLSRNIDYGLRPVITIPKSLLD